MEGTFTDNGGHPVGGYDVKYDDVRDWYQDFLTGLYKHIGEYISAEFEFADWKEHTIDFFFSVPTTWEGPIINKFEDIIKAAGFGMGSEEHSVEIQLTEAEAAAVYAVANPHHEAISVSNGDSGSADESSPGSSDVKEGDVILVCDSGGGTTVCVTQHSILQVILADTAAKDVSIVKVVSLKDIDKHDQYEMTKLAKLEQLDKVNGLFPYRPHLSLITDLILNSNCRRCNRLSPDRRCFPRKSGQTSERHQPSTQWIQTA